jgi:ACS family tartrate transporter-like MFS transporter
VSPLSPLDSARRKAHLRIIPLVFACYVIAYIDRTNVALAQLTMGKDLGFDNDVFSTGFGIFFIGYVLLEWPGALTVPNSLPRRIFFARRIPDYV